MPIEIVNETADDPPPVRRSGRQPKRTDKLEEFLSTTKRVSRKSAPSLGSDPPSQPPTDVETSSENSCDGNSDAKTVETNETRTRSAARRQTLRRTRSENRKDSPNSASKDLVIEKKTTSSQTPSDMDSGVGSSTGQTEQTSHIEMTSAEETEQEGDSTEKQVEAMKRDATRNAISRKSAATKNSMPPGSGNKKRQRVAAKSSNLSTQDKEDANDEESNDSFTSSSFSSEEGGYDTNALYCICRQKHNKRFMICCDRCEEWFHGDCVGITEARGRLMERNGEDYICPNCTAQKKQLIRPATSGIFTSKETGKLVGGFPPTPTASAAVVGKRNISQPPVHAVAARPSSSGTGEKGTEDLGIKGRIEKATNPTGKKKIKIFQPAAQPQAGPREDPKSAPTLEKSTAASEKQKAPPAPVQKVATTVEVSTSEQVTSSEASEEKATLKAVKKSGQHKCVWPGCDNERLPNSVYCGHRCIMKHAAVAIKSVISESEQDKTVGQNTTSQGTSAGVSKTQKKIWTSQTSSDQPNPDEDDEDAYAEEQPPPLATASWSRDHNYIAVSQELTPSCPAAQLNKKCMYLFEGFGLFSISERSVLST